MRAFTACLTVFFGFGAASLMAACSSDATITTSGDAGEAGALSSPAGGGSALGGSGGLAEVGEAGAAGAAGAPASTCAFDSQACGDCAQAHCQSELTACASDDVKCLGALSALEPCVCTSGMTAAQCETTFVSDGGTAAAPLARCFDANCADVCE